ncbi:MAG: hypothetical protein BRC22_01975 [Parcubacteria group bacterium QH_9_35_7]|nr:MAG: hypothetical protein BRC22_01975 [Parcubacteria group bacterium QH_9_35_7]
MTEDKKDDKFFHCCFSEDCSVKNNFWCNFAFKILITLLGILLAYLVVYFGVLIRNNIKEYYHIGQEPSERVLQVSASGEVKAKPDKATLNVGVETSSTTVEAAQDKNTSTTNKLISELKNLGIEEKNIKTENYRVDPEYDYSEGERERVGYNVSQNINLELNDTDMASKVINMAGKVGATDIDNLQYDIQDPEQLKQKARKKAIKKAKRKAKMIAGKLGGRLGSVKSYQEQQEKDYRPVRESFSMGRGGRDSAKPKLEPGTNKVSVSVNLEYNLK